MVLVEIVENVIVALNGRTFIEVIQEHSSTFKKVLFQFIWYTPQTFTKNVSNTLCNS